VCGILGIVGERQLIERPQMEALRDLLQHRGPDGAGLWHSPRMTEILAHRRLSIIDLSDRAAQPMVSQSGSCVVTYNGEIYNYVELKNELQADGVSFRTSSDTEVLLAAYEAWGTDCVTRLNGMFAFAIWDEAKQMLFAARDRLGEKPFFFHRGRDYIVFASEMKAILASGLVCTEPDYHGVYRYLVLRDVDSDHSTLFKGVQSLRPAHTLTYSKNGGQLEISRYWAIDPEHHTSYRTDREYEEHFLELLQDAVRIRLRADVSVGSSLSGGLDSSTIACLVSRQTRRGDQATFSARFRAPRYDEGAYIADVVGVTQAKGYSVYPNPAKLPDEVEALTWHQEEPFFSASVYAQWNVMRLAKDHGVTVLLDGQGGDETMAGYTTYYGPYLLDLLRQGKILGFLRDSAGFTRRQGLHGAALSLVPLIRGRVERFLRRRFRSAGIPAEFLRLWACESSGHSGSRVDSLHRMLHHTLTISVLPALLRYADRNSMAFSREVRLPFLDHRLVEFLFSIPSDQLIRGQTTKHILRRAAVDILPASVRDRKTKLGFAPPQSEWMRSELRGWIESILMSHEFEARPWVEARCIRRMWLDYLAGRTAYSSQIWRWVSLEVWARMFLDRQGWSSKLGVPV